MTIGRYQLKARSVDKDQTVTYTYRVQVSGTETASSGLIAKLSTTDKVLEIKEDTIWFGAVPAHTTSWSVNTFRVVVPADKALDLNSFRLEDHLCDTESIDHAIAE
jgi:hypothetical protein